MRTVVGLVKSARITTNEDGRSRQLVTIIVARFAQDGHSRQRSAALLPPPARIARQSVGDRRWGISTPESFGKSRGVNKQISRGEYHPVSILIFIFRYSPFKSRPAATSATNGFPFLRGGGGSSEHGAQRRGRDCSKLSRVPLII